MKKIISYIIVAKLLFYSFAYSNNDLFNSDNISKLLFDTLKNNFLKYSLNIHLKKSNYFLEQDGEKIWNDFENKLRGLIDKHSYKVELLSGMKSLINSIHELPPNFEHVVKENKIKTRFVLNKRGEEIEIFDNPFYEKKWNKFQKFCYRYERKIPGFTKWIKNKLGSFYKQINNTK